MFGYEFQFEQISFWLGFVAATLLWWLFSTLRKSWPRVKEFFVQQREIEKKRRIAGLDAQIREVVLQRAQKMHLASALFPLDDLLIIPTLIAPPVTIDPENQDDHQSLISKAVPYAPQWPELATNMGATTLTFPEALQNKADIAIIGQPGSGKTVALAYLASLIARRESAAAVVTTSTPFLLHVIDLRSEIKEKRDPIETVIKTISKDFPLLIQRQLPRFIDDVLADGSLLLLIDGLDELSPLEIPQITQYLKALKEKYPAIHLVMAASPEYLDGLTELGIIPLALTTWRAEQVREFVTRWGQLWTKLISPVIQKQSGRSAAHPFLLNSWLLTSPLFLTPLEWTARVWAMYAGDLRGPQSSHALEALYRRLVGKNIVPEALSALANLMLDANKTAVQYSDAEKYLSKYRVLTDAESPPVSESASTPSGDQGNVEEKSDSQPAQSKKITSKGQKLSSSGAKILSQLLNSGLLYEYSDGSVSFFSPLITGYLSTLTAQPMVNLTWPEGPIWTTRVSQYQFLTAQELTTETISQLLKQDTAPLFTNTLLATRWLKDAPTNYEGRSLVMRKIVQLMQMSDIPLAVRICMMTAAASSNDPAVANLSRQFLGSKNPETRQIASIGAGLTRDTKSVDQLTSLFADPLESVQFAACYALVSIGNPSAWESVTSAFQFGDESLRLAVGEALANHSLEGHAILKEAVQSEDILVRRAAVFGIARIPEPWAMSALEKIAVEDGQWVVRNAAGQAIDDRHKPGQFAPKPLIPAVNSPWLISYASKLGIGLAPNQSATPILINALKDGTVEQKIAALDYLKINPEDSVIKEIMNCAQSSDARLQNAALQALWTIMASGYKLLPASSAYY